MKFSKLFFVLTLMLSSMAFFSSCGEDDACDSLECLNGGTCSETALGDAVCTCPTGYSGVNCEVSDPCGGVTCPDFSEPTENNGTCECLCDEGYEPNDAGDGCQEARVKYYGSYNATDQCSTSGTFTYNVTISESNQGTDKFIIGNFGNLSQPVNVVATAINATQFTIPEQTFDGTGGFDVRFSSNIGTYNTANDNLVVTYEFSTLDNNGSVVDTETCTLTLAPQ